METEVRERAVTSDGFPRPFGDYSLLHRLGRGGMGDVFLARAAGFLGIQKVCVLKTVRADMTRDAEYVARFIDEARIVVQLSQRNICPVFDMGKVGESYYLAMEHVAGRDLTTVLRRAAERARSVAPDVALYLVSEILDALDYAHRLTDPSSGAPLHLVHRDVSPHNIMVSYEGEAKLIDFGLAASTLKLEQTESGIVLGKLSYMAPEQARADPVDGRCDQFAAAVVLYELLTGGPYYEGLGTAEVYTLVGRGTAHRPRRWDAIDGEIQAVLGKALAPARADRFGSCGDLREALLRINVSRGSVAGARELRQLMDALFTQERESDRRLLAGFSHPVSAPMAVPVRRETTRIATALTLLDDDLRTELEVADITETAEGSQDGSPPEAADAWAGAASAEPIAASATTPREAPTDDETHAVSRVVRRADAARARPARAFVGGGIAAAIGITIMAVALWPSGDPVTPSTRPPRARTVDAPVPIEHPAAPPEHHEDGSKDAPKAATVAAVPPESPRKAPVVAPTPPSGEAKPRAKKPSAKRRRPERTARGERPAPVARRPPLPRSSASNSVKLTYLRTHCVEVACAAQVAKLQQRAIGAHAPPDAMQEFIAALDRCLSQCGKL